MTDNPKLRILYVDNNADDHILFCTAAHRNCPDCEIVEAASPESAFDELAKLTRLPQMIISEGFFAGADGPAFIRELRKRFPNVPVVALSDDLDPTAVARAYEAGASGVIEKPGGWEQFVETVGSMLHFLEHCAQAKPGSSAWWQAHGSG